jgi:hypothetical protein
MAPDAAMWGDLYTVTDNEAAREDTASGGEAYQHVSEPGKTAGTARGHLWTKAVGTVGPEPRTLWLIVVGSIVALMLVGKTFKTAKA